MTAAEPLGDAPTSFRELVAAEVRAHLARRKMSGRALALALGEQPTWVSRRLNGIIPLDMNDVERIAAALKMTPLQLIAGGAGSMITQSDIGSKTSRYPAPSSAPGRRLHLVPAPAADYPSVARTTLADYQERTGKGRTDGPTGTITAERVNHAYPA